MQWKLWNLITKETYKFVVFCGMSGIFRILRNMHRTIVSKQTQRSGQPDSNFKFSDFEVSEISLSELCAVRFRFSGRIGRTETDTFARKLITIIQQNKTLFGFWNNMSCTLAALILNFYLLKRYHLTEKHLIENRKNVFCDNENKMWMTKSLSTANNQKSHVKFDFWVSAVFDESLAHNALIVIIICFRWRSLVNPQRLLTPQIAVRFNHSNRLRYQKYD